MDLVRRNDTSPTQPNKSLESGCHGCRFYCFLPSRHKTHKTWEGTSGMHLKKMDWEATASCREKTQNRTSWTTGFGQRCSPLKFRFINFAFQPFKRIASHHPCFFRWSTYTCYVQVQSHPFPQPSAQPCLTASDFQCRGCEFETQPWSRLDLDVPCNWSKTLITH